MKNKKIIPMPPKAEAPKAPEKAPETKAQNTQQVVVFTTQQIEAIKSWCYENLKAREFDSVMQLIGMGQTGSFGAGPDTKKN